MLDQTQGGIPMKASKRIAKLEERIAEVEKDLSLAIHFFNAHVSRHERVGWTDSVTKAMRVLCDYTGRHPQPGESSKNDPTQKEWDEDAPTNPGKETGEGR